MGKKFQIKYNWKGYTSHNLSHKSKAHIGTSFGAQGDKKYFGDRLITQLTAIAEITQLSVRYLTRLADR